MKKKRNKFTVVRDTREKDAFGYWFPEDDQCDGTIEKKLDTGDYSLLGYENLICIERKRTTGELAGNVTEARFERELERMASFKYRFVVCEFSLEDVRYFPQGSGIPKDKWPKLRVTAKFLMRRIVDIQMANIGVVFLGSEMYCRNYVGYVLRRVFEKEQG